MIPKESLRAWETVGASVRPTHQKRRNQRNRRQIHRAIGAAIEPLESRILLSWIGATSGTTNDSAHLYNNTANWAGGVIDDSFSGVTFSANTLLYLNAARTTGSTGLNLNYTGNVNLTLESTSSTAQTLTINGGIDDSGGGTTRTITLGNSSNPLNMSLNSSTQTFNIASGDTFNVVGVISSGGLTESGGGALILTGANTYSSGTTISAGVLQIGNGTGTNALPSTGSVTDNGTLVFNLSAATTINNTIGGSGGLTQSGSGGITLTAANTFSGTTTINSGGITLNNNNALQNSTVNVAMSNGALAFTYSSESPTFGGLSGSGAVVLTAQGNMGPQSVALHVGNNGSSNTYSGSFAAQGPPGSLTVVGGGLILPSAESIAVTVSGGTLTISGSTSSVTLNSGQLNLNTAGAITSGNTLTINGGSIDNTSGGPITLSNNNAQTWSGSFTFGGTNNLNLGSGAVTLGANSTVTTNAGTLTEGGVISGTSKSLTKAGTGTLLLNAANTYSGSTNINAGILQLGNTNAVQNSTVSIGVNNGLAFSSGIGSFTIGALAGSSNLALVDTASSTVALTEGANGSSNTYSGILSGAGSLKINGGVLSLTGNNTYTGGTTLAAGQLNLNSATAPSSGTLTINGGSLDNTSGGAITLSNNNVQSWGGNFTFVGSNPLDLGTGAVTLTANRTVTASASSLSVDGAIGGAFALTKAGAGTLILTGSSTYSGGTTISAGTLQVGNGGTGSLPTTGSITDNGTLAFDLSGNLTFANVIGGSGSVRQIGSATLTLAAADTFSGATTVTSGVLQLGNANAVQNSTVTLTQNNSLAFSGGIGAFTLGGLAGNASLALVDIASNAVALTEGGNGSSNTYSGILSGAGSLKINGGAMMLTASNSYSGGTTLSAGQLNLGSASAIGSGRLTINGGSIDNTSGSAITLSNNPTQTWNANFTFVGSNSLDMGSGAVTLTASVTVTTNGTATLTVSGIISGSGDGVTKAGSGTLTLSGTNTYSGGISLSAGQLNLGNAGAIGSGLFSIYGGILDNISGAPMTLSPSSMSVYSSFTFVGSNSLNLGTASIFTPAPFTITTSASNLTIGGGFYGPSITLTKAGAGALTLSSSSGQIPAVVLNAGQLNINAADISSLTINGGSIDNTSGSTVTLSNNPTQTWNADFTFVGSNPLNMGSGAVTLGGNRAVTTSASTLTINGAVSGAFSLTKAGAGTLALGGANTFSGGTTLSAGQLNINNATALGTGRFTIGGGSIDNTTSGSITLSNNNTESWNGDFTFIGTKPLNLGTGAITLGSSRTVTVSASTLTVGGALGDSGQGYGLTKAGSGTLLLNAANTYSGSTNINAGIVQLGNTNAAQNTFVTIGANNGLAFTTAINNFTLGGLAGNANETLTDVGSNAIALTEGGNGSNSIYSGLLSGSGSLKVNGGALTLTGANTFSGGTLVAAGQLNINNATAIGSGALTINSGTIDNTSGGTITLGNNNVQTWGGNFIFGGTNDLNLGAGAVTLTSNRTVTTTAGTLTEGGIIGGAFSLTKLGSGALKLTGNSTFSGGLTIGGGILLADNSSGSGAGSGAVTVNSGATLGGTGTISGAVTVNSGGTLTPGDGGTAIFNTGTLVLSSGSNLNIVLNGNTAGSGYSRVNVSGSATITGSNLNLSGTRSAHDGAQLSVINTTNGLTGTFSGLVQNGTVTFNGVVYSANYSAGGGNNMVLTANPATSTTTVSSSANSSVYGQTIVLTATLSSASSGTPTGTVTFYDGTTQIGQATLSLSGGQDQASIGTSALTLGSHSITASYGGDTNFTASTSAALTQTVSQDATNISIASSVNPSVFEQPVIFTATVTAGSPGSGTATGTVTFYDGSTQIGQSQLALVNGQDQASVSVSALSVASHSISAVYAGDSNFTASTSGTVSQTVNSEAPTISISGNSSVSVGSSYTLNLSAQYPSFDVDGDTISSWSINWGDGSSAQNVSGNGTNSISVTHSFTSTGNPVITASATDDDGGPYNSTNSITVAVSDPSTTDLIATATTTGSTYLRWVHDGANATYNIYRSTDGTNFSLITTVTGSAADSSATDLYQDTGLSPDTAYYYHVNKVFNSTVGPNSNTASATTAASSNNYGNQAIDTIVIPVFGEIVQSNVTLAAGAHYELIASGTMYLGGTTVPRADAEYGYDPYQDYHNPNSPWTDAVNFGISVNDTSIDKNHTYWGPYNTNHTYAIDVIGTGQKFSFVFFDDLYSDNAQDNNPGPLQVQIFGFSNPLAAAASLTATAETTRPAIDLGWHETSNNETAFEIDRSTDGTNFSALTTINENQPITINDFTYQDTAVTPGQTYYYRVIAEAGSTSAPPSNIARAQVPAFLPNVSLGSIPSSQEGTSLTLTSTDSPAVTGDALSYSWSIFDQNGNAFTPPTGTVTNHSSLTFIPKELGNWSASLTVTDTTINTSKTVSTGNITVAALPPSVAITGAPIIDAGATYTLGLTAPYPANDPDGDQISGWTVNWGDGTTSSPDIQTITGNPPSVTHVFTTTSLSVTISASASDDDGTYAAAPLNVQVAHRSTAPINLIATPDSPNNRIILTWVDNSTDETAFRIERSTDGANFSFLESATTPNSSGTGETVTAYDTTATVGQLYYYRVFEVNGVGSLGYDPNAPSNVASAELPPQPAGTATIEGTAYEDVQQMPQSGTAPGTVTFTPLLSASSLVNFNGPTSYYSPDNSLLLTRSLGPDPGPSDIYEVSSGSGPVSYTHYASIATEQGEDWDLESMAVAGADNAGGFLPGDIFITNNSTNNTNIVKITHQGTANSGPTVIDPWVSINEGGSDQPDTIVFGTGRFGGNLVTITSIGNVYLIDSGGDYAQLADLPSAEGLLAIPNDPTQWGPLAGTILVGSGGNGSTFYDISLPQTDDIVHPDTERGFLPPHATVTKYQINSPLLVSRMSLIPANSNLYLTANSVLLGASASQFAGMAGDILAYGQNNSAGGGLERIHYNPQQNTFQVSQLPIYFSNASGVQTITTAQFVFSTVGVGSIPSTQIPLANRTIFIDPSGNGQWQPGDPTTVTDSNGHYSFTNLAAGTYHVAQVLPPNWTQTAPSQPSYTLTVVAGQDEKGIDFISAPGSPQISPPLFTSTPPASANPGHQFRYSFSVTDPEPGHTMTYSLQENPDFSQADQPTIDLSDPAHPAVVWNVPQNPPEAGRFVLQAQDDQDGSIALQPFTLAYTGLLPVLTSAYSDSLYANGTKVDLTATAYDPVANDNSLVYFWKFVQPPNNPYVTVTFSQPSGTLTSANETVTFNQAGTYDFSVYAQTSQGVSETRIVTVQVGQILTTFAASLPSNMPSAVSPGSTVNVSIAATDQFGIPMFGSPSITWNLSTNNSGASLSSGTASVNYTAGSGSGSGLVTDTVTATCGQLSSSVHINVDLTPLTAPSNFTATALSNSVVKLNWTADSHAQGYVLTRQGPDGTVRLPLGNLVIGNPPYNDTFYENAQGQLAPIGLPASTTFTYRLQELEPNGELSALSASQTVTTDPLPPPVSVAATPVSTTQIRISWAGTTNASIAGWDVLRAVGSSATTPPVQSQFASILSGTLVPNGSSLPGYLDQNLTSGVFYWYEVVAVDQANGRSAPSAAVEATPSTTSPPAAQINNVSGPNTSGNALAFLGQYPLTSPTAIAGIAAPTGGTALTSWVLQLIPQGSSQSPAMGPITIASGTTAVGSASGQSGTLTTFDPSRYPIGQYYLQLTVDSSGGETIAYSNVFAVNSPIELGNFVLPVTDMTVNVPGQSPIVVSRVYDSAKSGVATNLGYGWTLNTSQARISTTAGTDQLNGSAGANVTAYRFGDLLYITLPSGQQHAFQFIPVPGNYNAGSVLGDNPLSYTAIGDTFVPHFVAVDGSGAQLSVQGDDIHNGGDAQLNYDPSTGEFWMGSTGNLPQEPYNPAATDFGGTYTLTETNGMSYLINGVTGQVETSTDANGNQTAYSADGKTITAGGVTVTLNYTGSHVTSIVASTGQSVTYEYDSTTGDLKDVIQPQDQGSGHKTFTYVYSNHYLTEIDNALGQKVAGASYDPNTNALTGLSNASGTSVPLSGGAITSGMPESTASGAVEYQTATSPSIGTPGQSGYQPAVGTEELFDSHGGVIRQIQEIRDSSGALTGYQVTVHSYGYGTFIMADAAGHGVDMENQLLSQADYKSFVISGTDSAGLRYTQSAATIASSVTYYPADPSSVAAGDMDQVHTQSTLASDGVTMLTTTYSNYVDGRASTVVSSSGNSTVGVHDSHGNLTSSTSNSGTNLAATTYSSYTDGSFGVAAGQLVESWQMINGLHVTLAKTYYYGTGTDSSHPYIINIPTGTADKAGEVAQSVDASGVTHRFDYDSQGNQIRDRFVWTNPSDPSDVEIVETDMTYDQGGRLTSTTSGKVANATTGAVIFAGTTTVTHYNTLGQVDWTQDQYGNKTYTFYDAAGRVVETRNPDGTESRVAYDALGRAYLTMSSFVPGANDSASTGVDGSLTLFDSQGRTIGSETLNNVQINVSLDANNIASETVNPSSQWTVLNSTSTTYYGQNTTGQPIGAVQSTVDASGQETDYTYDANGQQQTVTKVGILVWNPGTNTSSAQNVVTQYFYDSVGRQSSLVDPLGHVTGYLYNAAGQAIKTVFADGTSIADVYDAQGNRLGETDPLGHMTQYQYDLMGRLVEVDQPPVPNAAVTGSPLTPPATKYTFDQYGDEITQTDANGQVTHFTYDALGHQTGETLQDGETETFTYDQFGRKATSTDFDGNVTQYFYDSLGRQSQVKYFAPGATTASEIVTYHYDDLGQIDTATDVTPAGTRTDSYTYDVQGNTTSATTPEGIVNYVYDPVTNQLTRTWTSDGAVDQSYVYDHLGRLQTVTVTKLDGQTVNQVVNYYYDADGNLARTVTNTGSATLIATYSYDPLNRLTMLVNTDANGNLLSSYAYTLNTAGQRTQVVEVDPGGATRTINYTYDNLDRVTEEKVTDSAGIHTTDWSYDLVGNRLLQTKSDSTSTTVEKIAYTYNGDNELTTETAAFYMNGNIVSGEYQNVYGYDFNGSITSNVKTTSTTVTDTYVYDVRNRLISATVSGVTESYFYDDNGDRVGKTNSNGTTLFEVDDRSISGYQQVVAEINAATNQTIVAYAWGQQLIVQNRGGVSSFYLYDGHGNVRALTSVTATVTDAYRYTVFGVLVSGTGSTINVYTFVMMRNDGPGGMYYDRARYYTPSQDRFQAMDSAGYSTNSDPMSLHSYLFASANPGNRTDPSGHDDLGPATIAAMEVGRALDISGAALSVAYGKAWGLNTASFDPFAANGIAAFIKPIIEWLNDRPPGAATGWETWVPVYGSLKNAMAYFADGRFGWGVFYSIQIVADFFFLRSLTHGVVALGELAIESFAQEAARGAEQSAARTVSLTGEIAKEQAAADEAALGGSVRNVNPGFPNAPGTTTNCANCAIATDSLLGGNPASALPGSITYTSDVEAYFTDLLGSQRQFSRGNTAVSIEQTLLSQGSGARGVVFGFRGPGQLGHYFNVINQGGVIRFLDGQNGGEAVLQGFRDLWFLPTSP